MQRDTAVQVALALLAVAQIWLASVGLAAMFGSAAAAIIVASMILRFRLTFLVGTWLYALLHLGWSAEWSTVFAAPWVVFLSERSWPRILDAAGWVKRLANRPTA